jgi:hypothetical protein
MMKILLARAQQCGQVSSTQHPADETSQFITQAFMAGHQATIEAGGSRLRDNHWMDVCHTVRADFGTRIGSNLSLPTSNKLGQHFGHGTDVILPSEHQFNTHAIGINNHQHGRNNCIPVPGTRDIVSQSTVVAGMIGNLHPSYDRLSS